MIRISRPSLAAFSGLVLCTACAFAFDGTDFTTEPSTAAAPATLPVAPSTANIGDPMAHRGQTRPVDDPFPAATPQAVVAVTARVFPAVVRIDVAQEIYRGGKRDLARGIGSGVIIDKEGHILTNYHVAGRAAEINITLANKERVPGKLIGDDHWTDLAIVQLDMDTIRKRKIDFNFAELGESNDLLPGQPVIAIGTPFGLARTMTLGVVSNNERTFYPDRMEIDGYETGDFANWIQMDTPINPGNSGGPLVDLNGKLVGINTRGGGQNLNFAIPIDTAKEVIHAILSTATPKHKGRVTRSDLGLDFKPLQDLESFYDIDINKGVLINSVEHGSAAERAGVKPQDILLDLDSKPVNVRFPEELASARKRIADLPVGTQVQMTLKRGKEIVNLSAKTEKLQGALGEQKSFKSWGLSAREVTRRYANEHQLDDDRGVIVTTISPGLPAAKADLESGDVIRSIGEQTVGDLDDFTRIYDATVDKKDPTVLVEVQRGRGRQTFVLKVTY